MNNQECYCYDVDGYDELTQALRELIDQYPGLGSDEKFRFSELRDSGKALFPTTGAIIQQEIESITGHVTQVCLYPFSIVYRVGGSSEKAKVEAKEWLDTFGRWLEKQTVLIRGTVCKLEEYPKLSGERIIRNISRQSPAYLNSVNDNRTEDWVINMSIQYRNEFDK